MDSRVIEREWYSARVETLLMSKGVFAPTDEFDLNNTRTPEPDR